MKKSLLALAAAVMTFGVVAQSTTADAFFRKRSHGVIASQLIVGAGATALFLSKTSRHRRTGSRFLRGRNFWKWYGLSTVGCMAATPILGAAIVGAQEGRELRSSEVFIMTGDCAVPIVGGLFWQAMFDAHPEWDRGTGRRTR